MPQALSFLLIHIVFSTKDRLPILDATVRPALQSPGATRIHHPLEHRGSTQMTSAGFNRRLRKTACPVVSKGHGAQCPHDPIRSRRSRRRELFIANEASRFFLPLIPKKTEDA
jgi:hypothetical protein